MSDQFEAKEPSKRELLEERAKKLGIGFNAKTSDEILSMKIEQTLKGESEETKEETAKEEQAINFGSMKTRKQAYEEAMKLVRVIVSPRDSSIDLQGEIFTVANSLVGTITKYVPYNNENGWHIPNILYQTLKEKQEQVFVTRKVNGQDTKSGKLVPAFSITVLPPLTKEELLKLEQSQRARQSVQD